MAKAWFYLTLWRGTPPEFTDEITTKIQTESGVMSSIVTKTQTDARIKTASQAIAGITVEQNASVEIVTRTEVVWLVGNKGNVHRNS